MATAKPWYRRVWVWLLLTLVVLGVAFRILLDPVAAHIARKQLHQLEGYRADFDKLHISLHALSTTVTHFRVFAEKGVAVPATIADGVEGHLLWKDLFHGRLDGQAQIRKAKISLFAESYRPTSPYRGGERTRQGEERGEKARERGGRLARAEAPGSGSDPPQPDPVSGRPGGIARRGGLGGGRRRRRPSPDLAARHRGHAGGTSAPGCIFKGPGRDRDQAILSYSGKVVLFVTADPCTALSSLAGQVELRGLKLMDFYTLIKDKTQTSRGQARSTSSPRSRPSTERSPARSSPS